MKITIVATFTLANQNSASAYAFADKAFTRKSAAANVTHQIQEETSGNQRFIKILTVVNSTPTVTAQFNQYIQPTTNPKPGEMNLLA
ncbi:Uncharacterised protein [Streptococcus pneumoniae]|nr:Uncharacterised protein [Streptococcus pneumoniae]CJB36212.1 Uncharacterised protein [Streptococcus pneumoniae]CJC16621.1 Uncharacterised protein [Streptococcus pneumoniae]CRH97505.1 Uncharacterised protein [Streptococcus pneumoniae]CRI00611.1 Uncharacterised protein [Streptococcus pneumoniae]